MCPANFYLIESNFSDIDYLCVNIDLAISNVYFYRKCFINKVMICKPSPRNTRNKLTKSLRRDLPSCVKVETLATNHA